MLVKELKNACLLEVKKKYIDPEMHLFLDGFYESLKIKQPKRKQEQEFEVSLFLFFFFVNFFETFFSVLLSIIA